jgi:hypothetical protein
MGKGDLNPGGGSQTFEGRVNYTEAMERSPMDSTISTSPTQSFSPLVYF